MKFVDWAKFINWETFGWSGITFIIPIKQKENEMKSIDELEISDEETIIIENSEKALCEEELYSQYGIDAKLANDDTVEIKDFDDGYHYIVDDYGFVYIVIQ